MRLAQSINRGARRVLLNLGVSQHSQSMLLSSLLCLLSLPNAHNLPFVARFVTPFEPQSNLHTEFAPSRLSSIRVYMCCGAAVVLVLLSSFHFTFVYSSSFYHIAYVCLNYFIFALGFSFQLQPSVIVIARAQGCLV